MKKKEKILKKFNQLATFNLLPDDMKEEGILYQIYSSLVYKIVKKPLLKGVVLTGIKKSLLEDYDVIVISAMKDGKFRLEIPVLKFLPADHLLVGYQEYHKKIFDTSDEIYGFLEGLKKKFDK